MSPLFDGNPADINVSECTNHVINNTCGHKRFKIAIFQKENVPE